MCLPPKLRSQIVADGLEHPLDWQRAGYDMPPLEWHERLKEARDRAKDSTGDGQAETPIVLDCRNDYETQVGRFDLAEPLGTENFRDSWDVLRERLKDVPKDAPIMTYCTVRGPRGGARSRAAPLFATSRGRFAGSAPLTRTLRQRFFRCRRAAFAA